MRLIPLERTILLLTGPDTRGFLNNLLTNDLSALDEKRCLYAGLLTPQGKLAADMFVWAAKDGAAMLDVDPARAPDLLRRLQMFKLRADVDTGELPPMSAAVELDGGEGVVDPRRPDGALGRRRLVLADEVAEAPDPAALLALRLAAGVPDLAVDAEPEEVFALEALFEELHGVDFKKGCFPGQENVSRMKRRATTRRKFCPLRFDGPAPAPMTPVLADGAELGTVRSGMDGRALALMRLDRVREALDQGKSLTAGGRQVWADPPPWLIQPGGD